MQPSRSLQAVCALVLLLVTTSASSAAPAAGVSDLLGEWAWHCCDGGYSGRFQITDVKPDGSFSGRFMQTNANDTGTIEGVLRDDRVSFARKVTYQGATYEQVWNARLALTDGRWNMVEGFWNGYGETGVSSRAFSAYKVT